MKIYFKLALPVLLLGLVGCSKSADEFDFAGNISSGGEAESRRRLLIRPMVYFQVLTTWRLVLMAR